MGYAHFGSAQGNEKELHSALDLKVPADPQASGFAVAAMNCSGGMPSEFCYSLLKSAARTRSTNLGHGKQSLGDQNADVATNRAARSIAWILLTALAAIWVVASFHRFKNLDPRFDQSGNAVISLQMSRADHLFPRRAFRGQPIANATEADRSSWLRAPARTYIIEPLVAFDATSIFTNYVAMKLWRPTPSHSPLA